jgi:hypothetical protein
MTIGQAADGDAVVGLGSRPLLIVEAAIADSLDGVVLDVTGQTDDGDPQFVFRREAVASPGRPVGGG